LDRKQANRFYNHAQQLLNCDRPQIIFDMSETESIDSRGVDVLLRCLREAMKCDGDVKLAGLTPPVSIVLELTRIGQLFEVYENATSAAKSFSSFLPNVGFSPAPYNQAASMTMPETAVTVDHGDETKVAA
jgi:anti-anti-sigma factor